MPIPQLTRSPRDWEKYKKRFKKSNLIEKIKGLFSDILAKILKLKSRRNSKELVANLIVGGVIVCLVGGIGFVGLVAWYSRDLPQPGQVINRTVSESTKIYDRTGQTVLYDIHGNEKRTSIKLDQVSDYIIKATLTAEDRHFYEHHGINFFSIIQGVIIDPLMGRGFRGGSTLTQQFVKNAILDNKRSISRKIKEWILSIQLERKFSKDQILEMYFNEIPYGSVNYGVEAASNYFFSKHAKDVTLAEAAILAAIPQAPTTYSPYGTHTDKLFARQHWILDSMAQLGHITKDQAEAAKKEKIEFKKDYLGGMIAPHFVFYVKDLLATKLGEQALDQGGLKVITTLDVDKQKIAEEAVKNTREKNLKYKATNAALVSIDAKTGEILAMVGSQDFNDETIDGQVNVTIQPRQPGSSIKPVVYASAFEKGFTTETILYDVNTIFPVQPTPYAPHDYDNKERGPLTMRKALAGSLNIPAVKTLYLAGIEYVKGIMQSLGYSTINDKTQCGLSLTLGGCEVTLLDHVGAFSAFARDGIRAETAAILKVEDKNGNILDEFEAKNHKVFSENTARQVNSILSDDASRAYIFGAGSPLALKDRPVCAKTGTTNDNNDAWTVGYTPSFVTGVWVGNNNGDDMTNSADGVNVAAPIWNEYMRRILANTPVEYFQPPLALDESLQPVLRGIVPADIELEIDKASGKLATPLTPDSYRIKKKFNQNHDILYYVNKDNPQGPSPENPASDPMFQSWEDAIKAWMAKIAKEQNIEISTEQAPTEYDDLHVPSNQPTIALVSPQNNQTLDSYPVSFKVQASAPRGINRVVYAIDGQTIGTATSAPFDFATNSLAVANGYHKIKATAYDDIDNSASVEIDANFKLPYAGSQINWISPRDNASFYSSNFPLNINFSLDKPDGLQKMTFYYSPSGLSQATMLGEINSIVPGQMTINWPTTPASGAYDIYAQITDQTGNVSRSNELSVNILN